MSTAQFSDLWNGTPIYTFGTYLGGSGGQQVGCTPLPAGTRTYAVSLGYGMVPYYFGIQMGGQCAMTAFSSTISLNTSTAYAQGVQEAKNATSLAQSAGLAVGDYIFYDMEAFYANSGCIAAAQAFINGWDYQLDTGSGYWPGVYGSTCASHLSSYASIANVPHEIAPADQLHGTAGTTASVYGNFTSCLPDNQWNSSQRVRQYEDSPPQVYWSHNGSGSIPIDAECVDATIDSNYAASTITVNNCQYRYSL